jgi:hypothetical protein
MALQATSTCLRSATWGSNLRRETPTTQSGTTLTGPRVQCQDAPAFVQRVSADPVRPVDQHWRDACCQHRPALKQALH